MTKSAENCGFVTFANEILNGKLHFLCNVTFLKSRETQKVIWRLCSMKKWYSNRVFHMVYLHGEDCDGGSETSSRETRFYSCKYQILVRLYVSRLNTLKCSKWSESTFPKNVDKKIYFTWYLDTRGGRLVNWWKKGSKVSDGTLIRKGKACSGDTCWKVLGSRWGM